MGALAKILVPAIDKFAGAVEKIQGNYAILLEKMDNVAAAVSGEPHPIYWIGAIGGVVATIIFACIAYHSLRAARKANKLAEQINLRNKLIDDFTPIVEHSSELLRLLLDKEQDKDKYFRELTMISNKLKSRFHFYSGYTITGKYLYSYYREIIENIDSRNWTELTPGDNIFKPFIYHKTIMQIFLELSQLSRDDLKRRRELENESFNSYVKCGYDGSVNDFLILAAAMENLRELKPYDFSDHAPPQPKDKPPPINGC